MKRHVLAILLVIIGLNAEAAKPLKGIEPVRFDGALQDQNGGSFTPKNFIGKPSLVFFGLTSCLDICPLKLQAMASLKQAMGTDAAKWQFVMITVDPKHDSQLKMKDYLSHFDSSFIGLTGEPQVLAQVYKVFGIAIKKPQGDDHPEAIEHTASVFIVNPDGQIVKTLNMDAPQAAQAKEIKALSI